MPLLFFMLQRLQLLFRAYRRWFLTTVSVFFCSVEPLLKRVTDGLLWVCIQVRPVRRAQWWGSCVVWVLWLEHWGQLYHLQVRKIINTQKTLLRTCHVCDVHHLCLLHSLLDSWSSDLFSPHVSLLRCTSNLPKHGQEVKRRVSGWRLERDFLIFSCLNQYCDAYIHWTLITNYNNNEEMLSIMKLSCVMGTDHYIIHKMLHLPKLRDWQSTCEIYTHYSINICLLVNIMGWMGATHFCF